MKRLLLIPLLFVMSCAKAIDFGSLILPEEEELRIGKSYIPYAIEESDGLYPDKRVQEYVKSVGMSIAKHTPRRLPYEFFVVNSDTVNAFALPGGPVFITRGLLLKLNNESELAGVLGHELGHINARHHAKFLEKMYAINLLYNISSVLLADKPYAQALLQFGQVGGQLLALKFSRDQERQADELGVVYVLKAGYDPRGLLGVFETFKNMERTNVPEWLQTHPLPQSRIEDVQREIENIKPSGSLIYDTDEFQNIKKLLKQTENSYREFYAGKKAYQQKNYSIALSHFMRAVELYHDNYEARLYIAYILAKEGNISQALRQVQTAYSIVPEVFSTNYVYGFVLFKMGRYSESVQRLERAKKFIPDHADTYYYLGRDYEALGDISKAVYHYKTALELSQGKAEWSKDAQERLRRLQNM
ncbi:beta-barrel assembly-enhancing protease [Hydrogenobacter hydrogenophilus]|uniref:Putative Zn-dependent protease, contains TPR repeats n=1 Tax=Hydrogenobacter hydrogenophilus TaxID=35835 RepID=A0A285NUR9_9AQUI|nr:M48 family metalloprotease [Hydrogenobacter hydrogenophilus]SNZ13244.1 Putative Zn-dependent protease, contains TPR repeats [Hydrogenobacter hydrogenophilus]